MSIFNQQYLTQKQIKLDVDGLRNGLYSDKYFANVVRILEGLQNDDYRFAGDAPRPEAHGIPERIGDLAVEAQYFNRRRPSALVAGVDVALAMLRYGTGYFEGNAFIETWADLDVHAVRDGVMTLYEGDPRLVQPVIRVQGRYRDFALLETTMLGVLSRASRIATNVYNVLEVSNGKPVLFFPARFDLPDVQALDGYAYWLAVQRYNQDYQQNVTPLTSTDAQAAWWNGRGGGTVPHALIACFLGDTTEAMTAYARYIPLDVPRIALVDFNNDTVGASRAILTAYWPCYREAFENSDDEALKRWTLHGVRIDTSRNVRDVSMEPNGPYGIHPDLVRAVRAGLDTAWESWNVPQNLEDVARQFCKSVQIIVSGGFDRARIEQYEREQVPVDVYGVGSRFLQNDSEIGTDYSMDIVQARLDGKWVPLAKVGRQAGTNPNLQRVDLRVVE